MSKKIKAIQEKLSKLQPDTNAIECAAKRMADGDGHSWDALAHADKLNDQYSWSARQAMDRYRRLAALALQGR